VSVTEIGFVFTLTAFTTAAAALGLIIAEVIWQRIKPLDSEEFASHVKVSKLEEKR
jgi:hypothetical protein